ncbi:MAG: DUF2341 domain-containing protein, partial [Nevskia sp.]|nr:DUF2341 domain-containing protein [Nevskia sp.]
MKALLMFPRKTPTAPDVRRAPCLRLLALLFVLLVPATASASWWNHDWSYRKQIVIDAGAKGADLKTDLNEIPVLIRLHEGVFKFANANNDGSDLRFVAEDDKTPLKFHIEKFDSVFNLAFIWVALPKLKAGDTTKIWMYYGNTKAAADTDTRATYDPDQVLVYHFGERGTPVSDATGYANNSRSIAGVDESGLIGTGAKFDGQTAVTVPASSSLALAAGGALTWSAWIKPATADEDAVLYARHDGARSLLIGFSKGAPYVSVSDDSGAVHQSPPSLPLGDKGWHNLAVTAVGAQITLYVDGQVGPVLAAATPALNTDASFGAASGAAGAPAAGSTGFVGELDELQISKIAREPAYLQVAALNQGVSDKLIVYGQDEQLSSWSSGYVGVILKSVTLDGWVIIIVLLIMAVISWGVMASKAGRISSVAKGNKTFLELFRAVAGDFSALNHLAAGSSVAQGIDLPEEKRLLLQQAPLFHLFSAGVDELRQRLKGDGTERGKPAYLTPQSIEAIRSSLESSLVQETQALNRRMVLLTLAISGGPFIGLLGTVMGVMINTIAPSWTPIP